MNRSHEIAGSLHPHGAAGTSEWRDTGEPLVELDHVTSGYRATLGIEEISLRIWPGQFLAVVGPNGGGKTTLLRTILGRVQPTQGRVDFRGAPVSRVSQEKIGYVPQLETIDWRFPITVEEVILMGLYRKNHWFHRIKGKDRDRLEEVMSELNLAGLGKRHIRELSGGQQQAVFLARALIGSPELILLDEPASGLDIRSRDEVIHYLHEINHQGVAIVITAHDLNWVSAHLPWVVCLNRRIIAEGPPEQVFNPSVLKDTYRGEMVVFQHDGLIMIGERPHL
ncbi:MAG: ATP-binding cassette domain-containing protein [Deltaproteobacteria bacterium]|nr:ATP-binding cassette domain-containing protein [Deltaproteobacteria bacterium]